MDSLFRQMDVSSFNERFTTTASCLEFLSTNKWSDGYRCRNCGHTNYCRGKTLFSRRCTRCKHEESATAHTVFHHCRIPLPQAFQIAYTICIQPATSSYELSRQLNIRNMTCWKFKKRITACLDKKENMSKIESTRLKELLNKKPGHAKS